MCSLAPCRRGPLTEEAREFFIPLDGKEFEGKKATDIGKVPALMVDVQKQVEGALKQIFLSAHKKG